MLWMQAKCHGCLGVVLGKYLLKMIRVSLFDDVVSGLLKHSLEKQDLDIHCLMLLGAYQILYSNIAQHASIYETVNIADGLPK
jgi:hypothetical protein